MRRTNPEVEYLDTLRISDREWRKMVANMNRKDSLNKGNSGRREDRELFLHLPTIRVETTHIGGNDCWYTVRPHNISVGGMAFLHGQFLYNDTECRIELIKPANGDTDYIFGKVVFCRLVRGNIHEIGIKFEEPIDVDNYVPRIDESNKESAA